MCMHQGRALVEHCNVQQTQDGNVKAGCATLKVDEEKEGETECL